MALRTIGFTTLNRLYSRTIHLSATQFGDKLRDRRKDSVPKRDNVEGETGVVVTPKASYQLIDENLMDTVINNVKFKDIPIIHIKCTRNNTKISLVHGNGDMIAWKSAGTEGFKNCRKGTTVSAQAVANRILSLAQDYNINMARMVFNGLGPGRNAAYKVFEMSGFNVVSLSDRTQAAEPYNLRPRKARRI